MMRRPASSPKKRVSVDTKAGSLAYNRFDMQASQALHMAIELYPNMNYLLVLDHYDDITLFESDTSPATVSYYQMKTSEDSISIDTAISEDWIAKLYEQLNNPEWLVNELGLITNCPLRVSISFMGEDEKKHTETKTYSSEKTAFTEFNLTVVDKVKADIAKKKGIAVSTVDLSKFVHMRTTLSIPKHREIVEQEMGSFLQAQYPRITLDSVKAIYSSMMDLLTRRQEYELLDKKASFSTVREKKGVSKSDFSRVIDEAMLISIPKFSEVQRAANYEGDNHRQAALEYTSILEDFQAKSESFTVAFLHIRDLCTNNTIGEKESVINYGNRIYGLMTAKSPIYNKMYISVLVTIILINKGRRMQ